MNEAPKPASEVVSDILTNVSNLVRDEVALAKAEVGQKVSIAAGALGAMAFAGLLIVAAVNLIAAALVILLIQMELSTLWAISVVALGFALIALVIFLSAKSKLTASGVLPLRTARNIQRDAAAIKGAYHDQ